MAKINRSTGPSDPGKCQWLFHLNWRDQDQIKRLSLFIFNSQQLRSRRSVCGRAGLSWRYQIFLSVFWQVHLRCCQMWWSSRLSWWRRRRKLSTSTHQSDSATDNSSHNYSYHNYNYNRTDDYNNNYYHFHYYNNNNYSKTGIGWVHHYEFRRLAVFESMTHPHKWKWCLSGPLINFFLGGVNLMNC